ncbi:DUF7473 family protein [Natrononativus amylolyticus]|uniref:DUF7473 family protein n=1 Tax=Natrononativus amylolyticus TaxID=2963434 RepID=UPI0020CD9705|nr:hypothetical protein [Natrononativus amylolyticus]
MEFTVAQVTAEGIDPAAGGPLAYLGTFLVATAFYGVTLHIAARYVLGDVRVRRAFTVAPALALTSLLLQQWGPVVVIPVTLAIAYTAILIVYDTDYKLTLLISVIYYTVAALIGFTVFNVVRLLGTAPG